MVSDSDKHGMKPLDYTLYNKVKEKFPPKPGKTVFVSLKPENLEELCGIVFTAEEHEALCTLAKEHYKEAHPCATIGGYTEDEVGYEFYCREFEQEEDLRTGKIIRLSVGTYHQEPADIEALKKDLQRMKWGMSLEGNT